MFEPLPFYRTLNGLRRVPRVLVCLEEQFLAHFGAEKRHEAALGLILEDLTAHYGLLAELIGNRPAREAESKLRSAWLDDVLKIRGKIREIVKLFLDPEAGNDDGEVDLAAVYRNLAELAPDPRLAALKRRDNEAYRAKIAAVTGAATKDRPDSQAQGPVGALEPPEDPDGYLN